MCEKYAPQQWFEHLFGFSEFGNNVYEKLSIQRSPQGMILKSKANGRQFNSGLFSMRNLDSFKPFTPVGGGSLNLLRRGDSGRYVEVLHAQALPEFDGATFLAASNCNCLEFVDGSQTAGNGVTRYIYDRTQGPYCALAAGASIVYRNYFLEHDGVVGQLDHEINILKDTPLGRTVQHGYPHVASGDEKLMEELNKCDWTDQRQYCIGLHENCEVTTQQTLDRRSFQDAPTGRIIHQVYGVALSYSYYVQRNQITRKAGFELLKAQYALCIRAAKEMSEKYPDRKGSKKLVLCLLGTGVFGNSVQTVVKAITDNEELIIQSGLEVYITCYSEATYKEVEPLVRDVMSRTGGVTLS